MNIEHLENNSVIVCEWTYSILGDYTLAINLFHSLFHKRKLFQNKEEICANRKWIDFIQNNYEIKYETVESDRAIQITTIVYGKK
jgi:hypothetical protein